MAIQGFFEKLRPYKTVLQRTRPRHELPVAVLYVRSFMGEGKHQVLDATSAEHVITDKLLESNYKMATGAAAKKLIKEHWAEARPQPDAQ
ncbi:MAG: hypothetical protein VX699_10670 [Myxococcota bacterium]|nr:hypothetical protein [Myxococcota bacterium]